MTSNFHFLATEWPEVLDGAAGELLDKRLFKARRQRPQAATASHQAHR